MTDPHSCPQFQTRIEEVPHRTGTTMLPIRRCLLSERMVALLRPIPAAEAVLWTVALDPTEEPPVCLNGPDFDSIEHGKCTSARCEKSCSPRYRGLLARFGVVDTQTLDCAVAAADPQSPPSHVEPRDA